MRRADINENDSELIRSRERVTPLRILYVAYPLLTVSEESAGGAEQILWILEREMAARGAITTVAASAGSRVSGELFATGALCTQPDDFERRNREHQEAIAALVHERAGEGRPFDLIHDHSGSFWARGAALEVPILATIHLPRGFYKRELFENVPRNVSFNCVSDNHAATFSDLPQMRGVISNGIAVERFEVNHGERNGLLWLGRICEEKAPHLALEIAARAGMSITIAGRVYPFSYHQKYFETEVAPRLRPDSQSRFIEAPSSDVKRDLLRQAKALLITSLVDETSSLVAMEAGACGTPAVAFNRGAIPDVVKHGVTGFLVKDAAEAVEALTRIQEIDAQACARRVRENFSAVAMAGRYARFYEEIVQRDAAALAA